MANTKKVHDAALRVLKYFTSLSNAELKKILKKQGRASSKEIAAYLIRMKKFEEESAKTKLRVGLGLTKAEEIVGAYELVMSNSPSTIYTHPSGGVIVVEHGPKKKGKKGRNP